MPNIPEAEVALRLAEYLLDKVNVAQDATVSIDGAAARQFAIRDHLVARGWQQIEQQGVNAWSGTYVRGGKRLEVHTRPGEGDVVVPIGSHTVIAECKKGPRERSRNGAERRLLAEVIGQATKWPEKERDIVMVAVPRTEEFERVAQDWLKSPLFQRTGIGILLVGEDDTVLRLAADGPQDLASTLQNS